MAQQNIAITTLPDGKICDYIDQKIRNDTPEEYVRQNIERRLVLELGFEPEQIAVEFPMKSGSARRRIDLAIFPKGMAHIQENAWILIECKRDNVQPSDRNEGVEQLKTYLSDCLNSEWGMWTNGRFKSVYRKIWADGRYEFEEPNDIPSANGSVEEIGQGPFTDGELEHLPKEPRQSLVADGMRIAPIGRQTLDGGPKGRAGFHPHWYRGHIGLPTVGTLTAILLHTCDHRLDRWEFDLVIDGLQLLIGVLDPVPTMRTAVRLGEDDVIRVRVQWPATTSTSHPRLAMHPCAWAWRDVRLVGT